MESMQRANILLLLAGSLIVSLAEARQTEGSDVRILQSSASGITLEYRPAFARPESLKVGGALFIRPNVAHASVLDTLRPGSPELALRRCLLRFPGSTGNSVELLASEYEDVQGISLLPRGSMRRDSVGAKQVYAPDRNAYAAAGFFPSPAAALEGIRERRGVFLGSVLLAPFQYNPSAKILRRYTRLVVSVRFGSTEPVTVPSDAMTKNLALNDQQFQQAGPAPVRRRPMAVTNSVLATGPWYKFTVTDEGMYKITGQELLNLGVPSTTDPSTIRIFGNGGFEPPMGVGDPYPDDLRENAVYVSDGGVPGALDAGDYVVFYGKAASGWTYDGLGKTFHHYVNRFASTNVYWLTYGGVRNKAMAVMPVVADPAAIPVTSLDCKVFREDEKVNLLSSGLEWLGPTMNSGDQMVYVSELTGLDHSRPIIYRFHLGASSNSQSIFSIAEHGSALGGQVVLAGTILGDDFSPQLIDAYIQRTQVPVFTDNQSQIRLSFVTVGIGGNGFLDWYELLYGRLPRAAGDLLSFSVPDSAANFAYALNGFSAGTVTLFDVSQYDSVTVQAGLQRSADTCFFQISGTPGNARQLYVVGPGGYKSVGSFQQVANQNLHGDPAEVANIIITDADLRSAADRLKSYREQSAPRPLSTKVVDVAQIYNEFGGGLLSPVAIRNYLRYVFSAWQNPPQYVLLFGSGSFDYRGILAGQAEGVPPWETEESFLPIFSYATDDAFAVFSSAGQVNMGVGRLTAESPAEANAIVDKIIEYETRPQEDPWKIRVTMVADDALAGVLPNGTVENDGTTHLDHAENVARQILPLFEKRKIYLFNYPTEYTPAGRRKPDVNRAIVGQINEGTLLVNYSGHGNPDLWAHEHVFVRETDFPLLANKGKYFFLVAATCNYSAFDALSERSSGEVLVLMPNAGSIAVFSATRAVISFYNEALNDELFHQLFRTDASGRLLPERLGEIVFRTKQTYTGENDQKFFLLGDPAMTIDFPPMFAQVDSINHLPATQTAQLKALGKATMQGSVRDSALQPISSYAGSAQVVVYDADQTVQLNDPDAGLITYKTAGSVLFRGTQSVSGGTIGTSFIVPKDISYGNDFGRVTLYFWNASSDGAGYSTNFTVGGTDSTAPPDTKGPDIRLFIDTRSFRPGDIVSASPVLIADLTDSSGINTSGSGVGHRLEMWLDESPQSTDVSAFYQTKPNTYQEGTIQFALGPMANGSHKLRLRAWDTYNNPSMSETIFNVVTGSGLQLDKVYTIPNPVRQSTFFTFEHNQVVPIEAEVKIFTVAGRLIQTIRQDNLTTQFVRIPWDGRDRDGDLLANGVYLYKILASTEDGRFSAEATGKLSIEK